MLLSTAVALDDSELLQPYFKGKSWDTWRAVLAAFEGRKLTPTQSELFEKVAERTPPKSRVRELWCVVGRRGGKDSIASAIATIAAIGDYRPKLRPGERATILCIACNREQARIVHGYISGYFSEIELLKPLVERENADGLSLTNSVDIVIATNSFRSVRGRTVACAILDECAFYLDENSAKPDIELYNALLPSLVNLDGQIIGISTPYRKSGLLYEKFARSYAQDDPDTLVIKGTSRQFNPTLSELVILEQLNRDRDAASAEWLGEFRSDVSDFISRDVIDKLIIRDRYELAPVSGKHYHGLIDFSGGSGGDSSTLSIAHNDKASEKIVLDCIREVLPPFSPKQVAEEFANLLRAYHIAVVVGDRFAGEWPREQLREHGVTYQQSEKHRSHIYLEALPLLNSAGVELLDNQRLISQICSLERRSSRIGRDIIDHPRGQHDDMANAALGAIVNAQLAAPMRISGGVLQRIGHPTRSRLGRATAPIFDPRQMQQQYVRPRKQ